VSTPVLQKVGSISLLDLDIISKFYGREFLPYPFMLTHPPRFSAHDDYVQYATSVPDRFNSGDLAAFQQCAGVYANADIRVECHVQYIPADTPSVRVVAARHEQTGFLAKQRPDDDIIDVSELSAYLLGPAVAESVPLDKPGHRSGIVIPAYAPTPSNPQNSDDVIVRQTVERESNVTTVAREQVSAFGTVQSHWRPTRCWGVDPHKNVAVWVRIKDDGEYLYQRDFTEAVPMTRLMLAKHIDRLIAEDVKALRQFRHG
jgi:hypothetical protein